MNTTVQPLSLETSEDEDEEAHLEEQSVPLIGSRLGGMSVGEEENEGLERVRLQATPRKLFVSMSQPSPSNPRRESRPSFSSPLPPLNPSNTKRSKRIAKSKDRHRQRAMDDSDDSSVTSLREQILESNIRCECDYVEYVAKNARKLGGQQ